MEEQGLEKLITKVHKAGDNLERGERIAKDERRTFNEGIETIIKELEELMSRLIAENPDSIDSPELMERLEMLLDIYHKFVQMGLWQERLNLFAEEFIHPKNPFLVRRVQELIDRGEYDAWVGLFRDWLDKNLNTREHLAVFTAEQYQRIKRLLEGTEEVEGPWELVREPVIRREEQNR